MNFNYRGHEIRITRAGAWSAQLVELRTGAMLPTRATAEAQEALTVCVERAVCLVDLYLEGARRARSGYSTLSSVRSPATTVAAASLVPASPSRVTTTAYSPAGSVDVRSAP